MLNRSPIINVSERSSLVYITIKMKLAEKHIDEFIDIYHQNFGVVLERDMARLKGLQLVRLVEMVEYRSNVNGYGKQRMDKNL